MADDKDEGPVFDHIRGEWSSKGEYKKRERERVNYFIHGVLTGAILGLAMTILYDMTAPHLPIEFKVLFFGGALALSYFIIRGTLRGDLRPALRVKR